MAHQPTDGIVYQPRCEHWYEVNKRQGTLPKRYADMSLLDLYDDLRCSLRTYHMFNWCLKYKEGPKVKYEEIVDGAIHTYIWTTPLGSVQTRMRVTESAWHTEKYPVESPDDARVMEYIVQSREYEFDLDLFEKYDAELGDRAAPMMCFPRINIQRLFLEFMGVEPTLYALVDTPEIVERLIEVINRSDDQALEVMAKSPLQIINFGDNIDQHFLPPYLLERFVLPQYHHRVDFLHKAGKYMHAHWDGSVKALLPLAKQTRLDGIEALTPLPQGDVTIPEIADAIGDMVLLDGIPMTSFLPSYSNEDLEADARQVIETFSPNLILGVSDEPSPVCDIEKVRLVSEIVESYNKTRSAGSV